MNSFPGRKKFERKHWRWLIAGLIGIAAAWTIVGKFYLASDSSGAGRYNSVVEMADQFSGPATAPALLKANYFESESQSGAHRDREGLGTRESPLSYDSYGVFFGRVLGEGGKRAREGESEKEREENPLSLVGTKRESLINRIFAISLEEAGVNLSKKKFPPLTGAPMGGGADRLYVQVDSPLLAGADKELQKKKPITEEESRLDYAARRAGNGLRSLEAGLSKRIRGRAMGREFLRRAAQIAKYALAADDPDSSLLLGRFYATGENPYAALNQMRRGGRVAQEGVGRSGPVYKRLAGDQAVESNVAAHPKASAESLFAPPLASDSLAIETASVGACTVCRPIVTLPGPVIGPAPEPGPMVSPEVVANK